MASLPQSLVYEAYSAKLAGCGYNLYSQYGEDGLIERLLDLIGAENLWCFECGAADGVFYSNTLRLRQSGWSAVLIEAEESNFAELAKHSSDKVWCVQQRATDLDSILGYCEAPRDIDLGVIDVDGQDYWLWHDMEYYRPRVLMIEFHWADGESFIPPKGWEGSSQAGRAAIEKLAKSKGYTLAAKTHVNLIYVRNDCKGWY